MMVDFFFRLRMSWMCKMTTILAPLYTELGVENVTSIWVLSFHYYLEFY